MRITSIRGMQDYLFSTAELYNIVTQMFLNTVKLYNYHFISTPILEKVDLFTASLGTTSDVVSKEMYSFEDKGGDYLVLRPEGTASVVRALVEHNLYESLPAKFAYFGPMFRYERPQKGRYRQFHQLGVECFSNNDGPARDAESIIMASNFLQTLKVADDVTLEVSTLGSIEDRKVYLDKLSEYLISNKNNLSELSRERLNKNPLRILDSKEPEDLEIITNAPKIIDNLGSISKDFFNSVTKMLQDNGVKFVINPSIVRGLDYYTHTVFEFKTDKLGAQSTVLAGGRYDNFVKLLNGPDVSGTGWAAGFERLSMLLAADNSPEIDVVVVSDNYSDAITVSEIIRKRNLLLEFFVGNSFKKLIQKAVRLNPKIVIFIGEDERKLGKLTVKNMELGKQVSVDVADVVDYIEGILCK